ncbi:ATP-binding protein [Caldivirga sp.]|uniref:ATP-binding protein n=1 Tax=Caldivirga sp. TaxID=2080243 RepID=UPI0025BA98D4|nr:ATP-binding protein [Caldivirga sp.]
MTLTPSPQGEEFFDLDEVINEVEKLVEGKFWPLLIGPKRTGKTSILRIVARELNGIYVDASGIRSVRDLGYSLVDKAEVKLQVDLKFIKVEINKKPTRGVQALLDRLRDSIILIDEVQSLISPWFLRLLANAYNNSQVRFAFTGSMIGLAKSLTRQGKGDELGRSFKGRPVIRVEVSSFNEDKDKEFLLTGFRNCGVVAKEEEVEDAVRAFRGFKGG